MLYLKEIGHQNFIPSSAGICLAYAVLAFIFLHKQVYAQLIPEVHIQAIQFSLSEITIVEGRKGQVGIRKLCYSTQLLNQRRIG